MGQEAFKSIVKSHYKNVAAVLFIYSIEKRESYDKLGMWVKEVKENVHEETMFFVLGTKLDLEDVRKVPREDGEAYSKSIKAHSFHEISSKTGENVKEVTLSLVSFSTSCASSCSRSTSLQRLSRSW